jgi:eukaryotic-like serine/threonine-protein kinase
MGPMSFPGMLLAGRYRLESRIAAGAVGEVWRAGDQVLDRLVAVKLLQQGYAGHPQTLARFRAEARHAGSLTHPGIAQVYDYGEAGPAGVPYLVLELVDGPSLAGVLDAGPLDPGAAMDVVAQVAAALAAAHATGLVHRDVKPANLLMGRDGLVKITDFGIAHAAGSAPLTQAGMLVGTPAYLAPERAAGEPATAASDLYALGIVAYECLTGAPPFHGTPIEVAGASRFQPLPPLPAAVPAPVASLVADLAAKDPAARPGSAAEVAARAGQLRDSMNGGLPGVLAGRPDIRSPARTGGHTAVLLEPQGPATELLDPPSGPDDGWPPGGSPAAPFAGGWRPAAPQPGRRAAGRWPGRRGWVATLAAAMLVALAGWLLARAGGGPAQPPVTATSHRASSGPGTHGPAMVTVNAAALLGRPVGTVREYLAGLGLRPRVVRSVTDARPPGTVVSVQPSGRVAEGSIVTVAAAVAPPGHRHHHGNGHGEGDGGGDAGSGHGGG